jgi:hypothetical protein
MGGLTWFDELADKARDGVYLEVETRRAAGWGAMSYSGA